MSTNPLITAVELSTSQGSAEPPLVIDARPAHEFAHGLIPGAVHLDLWGVSLVDTSAAPLRAFMWMVGHLFSQRGVVPERPVVVYETDAGIRAARVFWFLEYLGHPDVRVLDGGYRAWTGAGLPVGRDPQAPVTSAWHGTPIAERLATWEDVRAALGRSNVAIVDTRSRDEYLGRMVRARRGGAIPGAVNLEWTNNLSPDGFFKNVESLRQMYDTVGVTSDKTVMTYCQGGYRAAHTYLALRILGYPDVRNYTGSWQEWGDREDLPVVVPAEQV